MTNNTDKPMELREKIVQEILKSSEGHMIEYDYLEEDGSTHRDKAIPDGWFVEWLRVAVSQAIQATREETVEEIKALVKDLIVVEPATTLEGSEVMSLSWHKYLELIDYLDSLTNKSEK